MVWQIYNQAVVSLLAIRRDRVLQAILGAALFLFLLVPMFSLFSMRQVQELAVTLTLSVSSALLLVFTLLKGASAVWHDFEKKYLLNALALPSSRSAYLLGKFAALSLCLLFGSMLLAGFSALVINIVIDQYPSARGVEWENLFFAFFMDGLKYILLSAVALAFSTVSTSFFLPIFGTLAVYFAGHASQNVMEFVTGPSGERFPGLFKWLCMGLYYALPNFTAFDLKVYAVYALSLDWTALGYTLIYFGVYTSLVLLVALHVFSRREIQ